MSPDEKNQETGISGNPGGDTLKKSNYLIMSKYKMTLLEEQVLTLALSKLKVYPENMGAQIQAVLFPNEISRIISDKAHIYRDLKRLSASLTSKNVVIEDGKGNYNAFAIIPEAPYENGQMTITFSRQLLPYVTNLTSNFTLLSKAILSSFKHIASHKLYQVLRKELYHCDPDINDGKYDIYYNISELRFVLGFANADNSKVKERMGRFRSKESVDWDYLYSLLPSNERKYERWRDFASKVLKPAQEEITEKSDLSFTYEPVRSGRNIRIVKFTIFHNIPVQDHSERMVSMEQMQEVPSPDELEASAAQAMLYNELVRHNGITRDDVTNFLKLTDGDVSLVRKAVEKADRQPELRNYIGYIISCIRNHYEDIPTLNGSAERAQYWAEYDKKIEEQKASGEYWENLWVTIKAKDEFSLFEEHLFSRNSSVEAIETFYPREKQVDMFYDWYATYRHNQNGYF